MCRKAKCAYLRANGYCLLHKAACDVPHPDVNCRDGAARAIPSRDRHLWESLREWDFNTANGRLAFRTRNARGHDVYRTCSRKRRYASFYEAREKAIELKRRKGLDLLAYECPFCGGYHLTHQARRHLLALNGVDDVFAADEKTQVKTA